MYLCTLGMLCRKEFITNNPNPAMPSPRKQVLCSKISCIPMCINHSVYTNVGGNNLCGRQALLAHWRRQMGLEDDKCRRIMESLAKSSLNIHETSFRGLNVCLQLFFFLLYWTYLRSDQTFRESINQLQTSRWRRSNTCIKCLQGHFENQY